MNITVFQRWFGDKLINVSNWKKIREHNLKEYGNDPEINNRRMWGIHTNGAKKGNPSHSCLDITLNLGHISINYVNFNYNAKYGK